MDYSDVLVLRASEALSKARRELQWAELSLKQAVAERRGFGKDTPFLTAKCEGIQDIASKCHLLCTTGEYLENKEAS